jgi:hypothetical protein
MLKTWFLFNIATFVHILPTLAPPPRASNKRVKHGVEVAVNSLPTMLKAVLNGPIALIPGDDSDEPGNLLLYGHTAGICEQTFALSLVTEGSN